MKKILIFSFIIFLGTLFSEEIQKLRPYKLINADKLQVKSINDSYMTFLEGNVHFFYGDTEFFSDEAQIFEERKVAKLFGNVRIYDDSLTVTADETTYFRKTEKLHIKGNSLFQEDHADSTFRTFKTEEFEYDRNQKIVVANQDVKTYDSREEIHHSSGYLYYEIDNGYGYLMNNPIVYISGKDSLLIRAEKMEFFKEYEKIVASFNVLTQNNDIEIKSSFLVYFTKKEEALFVGDPKLKSEFADTESKELTLVFEENKIKKAILRDSTRVEFSNQQNQKINWINAENMNINFGKDNNISTCVAEKNVKCYIEENKDEKNPFKNIVNGNELHIKMSEDNKVETLKIFDNVVGTYYFKAKQ